MVLNFIGQIVPLAVGIVTLPFIVRGLGPERFGILSLAWVVLGYFAVFDLGLGRATTKFVAEALGRGEETQVPRLVWTAVATQAMWGAIGALAMAGITPMLMQHLLKIPLELIDEAKLTFYILAFSVPVVLVSGSFRGVLEAYQRFDLVNVVRVPTSVLTFILSLIGVLLGLGLPGIVALILIARIGALISFIALDFHIAPGLKIVKGSFLFLYRLLKYGGWITVTSIIKPILIYLDRFLIGALLSVDAVAYYSAPYEAVSRLTIIPASLTMALFPAFSSLEGLDDRHRIGLLLARSIKYIFITLGPIVLVIMLFAKELLQIWLGVDFAIKGAAVLQIIAIGVLINSFAYVPSTLLNSAGRPDIPAKIHLLELPIYVGIAWFLISRWGIVGAAGAWSLRIVLDTFLLFGTSFKIYNFSLRLLVVNGVVLAGLALVTLSGIAWVLEILSRAFVPLFGQFLLILCIVALFIYWAWSGILDDPDRQMFLKMARKLRMKFGMPS